MIHSGANSEITSQTEERFWKPEIPQLSAEEKKRFLMHFSHLKTALKSQLSRFLNIKRQPFCQKRRLENVPQLPTTATQPQ
jgi:hypothetical protein